MNEKYMIKALKLAKKAKIHEDVPVGSIIVKDKKIISQAFNKKENKNNAVFHAEILAIKKACKKLKTWRLDDCTLYTTMEPCMMCCGAIIQSRIKKIVFGTYNENYGSTKMLKNVQIIPKVCEKECKNVVVEFFKNKR